MFGAELCCIELTKKQVFAFEAPSYFCRCYWLLFSSSLVAACLRSFCNWCMCMPFCMFIWFASLRKLLTFFNPIFFVSTIEYIFNFFLFNFIIIFDKLVYEKSFNFCLIDRSIVADDNFASFTSFVVQFVCKFLLCANSFALFS